jgi:hypothetical protein
MKESCNMRFFLPSIIVGALLNLLLFSPSISLGVYPEWYGSLKKIDSIEASSLKHENVRFFVRTDTGGVILNSTGSLNKISKAVDSLSSWSGNGLYHATYKKVGDTVELYGINGERFWSIKSKEYPHLSKNGKLVILINGDQTRARFFDHNGNAIGDKEASGHTCTVVSFSDGGDWGALGFLDGRYYLIGSSGKISVRGITPADSMVKGIAVSSNGLFLLVHYGDTERDFVRIVDVSAGKESGFALKNVHHARTALYIAPNGRSVVHDMDRIISCKHSGKTVFIMRVPEKRPGSSNICRDGEFYMTCYTARNGDAKAIVFLDDGTIVFSREFSGESFMHGSFEKGIALMRGSDNLYCYRFLRPKM